MAWFYERGKKNFAASTSRLIFFLFLVSLFFLFLFRSCTSDNISANIYYIGQDSSWRGLGLMGKEPNLSAFNNNLLAAVARLEHIQLNILIIPSSQLISNLEQGKVQGILTALKPAASNEKYLLFSKPYFLTGPVLIVRTTAPIKGWNEMAKKIIGVQSITPAILNLEKDLSIQVKLYDDILQALADLREGRIDGVVYPAIAAHIYTKTFYGNELKIATQPLTDDGLRLATLNNEAGQLLIRRFNDALAKFKQNGTYDQLIERWGLVNVEKINHHSE